MIVKYGGKMDAKEYKDFVADYELEVEKANEYLQNDSAAVSAGITNYEAFCNIDMEDSKKSEYHNSIIFERGEDLFWELQARENLIDYYDNRIISLEAEIERATGMQKERLQQLLHEEKYGGYTSMVVENFQSISTNIAIILLFSNTIAISPIFLRDRVTSVISLQYTSKKGRDLYRIKWLAGFASMVFVTIVLLTLYLALYSTNDTSAYFDLPLHSFVGYGSWYDISFFQYIILSVMAIFVVAVLIGILSMGISTIAKNYIVLIGIQIVVISGMIALVSTFMVNDIVALWDPKWLMPTGYILLIIITAIFSRFVWRRELRRDLL
ncbi:hypothetical protein [Bacillus sp. JJ722]|uniref:hypothetical protein n=1 Tax=Bacillus sp. JJ722 TaxID=3122973 RepID=UPI002FFFC012